MNVYVYMQMYVSLYAIKSNKKVYDPHAMLSVHTSIYAGMFCMHVCTYVCRVRRVEMLHTQTHIYKWYYRLQKFTLQGESIQHIL